MADGSGGNVILGVIVGAVIVIGVIFFAVGGTGVFSGGGGNTDINVELPKPEMPDAKPSG